MNTKMRCWSKLREMGTMAFKHSYKEYVEYFAKMRKMEMQQEKRGSDIDITPGRAASRANALANLQKLATKIEAHV